MTDLKPCPFCGGEAIMKIQKHIPSGYEYTPTCKNPSCAGRLTKKWLNETEAIEAWNRAMGNRMELQTVKERTAKAEKVDTNSPHSQIYKCCKCGQYTHRTAWSRDVHYCPSCGARLEWE